MKRKITGRHLIVKMLSVLMTAFLLSVPAEAARIDAVEEIPLKLYMQKPENDTANSDGIQTGINSIITYLYGIDGYKESDYMLASGDVAEDPDFSYIKALNQTFEEICQAGYYKPASGIFMGNGYLCMFPCYPQALYLYNMADGFDNQAGMPAADAKPIALYTSVEFVLPEISGAALDEAVKITEGKLKINYTMTADGKTASSAYYWTKSYIYYFFMQGNETIEGNYAVYVIPRNV